MFRQMSRKNAENVTASLSAHARSHATVQVGVLSGISSPPSSRWARLEVPTGLQEAHAAQACVCRNWEKRKTQPPLWQKESCCQLPAPAQPGPSSQGTSCLSAPVYLRLERSPAFSTEPLRPPLLQLIQSACYTEHTRSKGHRSSPHTRHCGRPALLSFYRLLHVLSLQRVVHVILSTFLCRITEGFLTHHSSSVTLECNHDTKNSQ